jgi:poly-gamma-glutamate capsule biosynthesis protein CapA/YwtB (metallophosphatase superfamily)
MKRCIVLLLMFTCVFMQAQDTTRLSLLFLGDIMQHDSQISDAFDPVTKKFDYSPCFQFVKPYTESADVAIGNLELTLAGPPHKGYPQFSAPDELLVALKNMGMDVLVTANNHCADRGKRGIERTVEMLDSFDILHTGTFADEVERLNLTPLLIEKSGFRLALLNYTYGTNGMPVYKPNIVNLLDTALIVKDLKRAKELSPDIIIVFTHWGSEYQSLPSLWQKQVTKICFKYGAQIVIGAHPHVIQPMEWNKKENQLVAYSLGNFISGQRKRYTDGGAMIRIELEKVRMADNITVTGIDTAGYVLQWVYRDQDKNYYVLPVPTLEPKVHQFLSDETALSAFRTFVQDSRALLGKHNLQIAEIRNVPEFTREGKREEADSLGVRKAIEDESDLDNLRDSPLDRDETTPFSLPPPSGVKVILPDSSATPAERPSRTKKKNNQ